MLGLYRKTILAGTETELIMPSQGGSTLLINLKVGKARRQDFEAPAHVRPKDDAELPHNARLYARTAQKPTSG